MNGVKRNIDKLGRCCIPIEFRRTLGLSANDEIEMTLRGDCIVIRNPAKECAICGSKESLLVHPNGKHVCAMCVALLRR